MKYSKEHYNEYITYLLTFECQIGNANASLSSLYITSDEELVEKAEKELIDNLEFEQEDTQFYNEKDNVVSVHDFVSKHSREEKLKSILD